MATTNLLPDFWEEPMSPKATKSQLITVKAVRVDEDGDELPPRIPKSFSRRQATSRVARSPNTIRNYEKMARILVPGFNQELATDSISGSDAGEGCYRIKRQAVADVIHISKGRCKGSTRRRFPLTEYQVWVLREIGKLHDAMVSKERVKNFLRKNKRYYSYEAWLTRQNKQQVSK